MNLKRPLWVGFSLAPLAAPLVYGLWAIFFWTDPTPKQEFSGFDSYAISAWVFAFANVTLMSYIVSLGFGLPLVWKLRGLNRLSFWRVVLPAAVLGAIAVVGSVLTFMALGAEGKGALWHTIWLSALFGSLLGFVVAASFCILTGITRPSGR